MVKLPGMNAQAILFPNVKLFNVKEINKLCSASSFIVAIDGGTDNALKMGIIPHIVIGDMDSISLKAINLIKKKKIEIIQYPKDKDKTDFELALDHLLSKDIRRIVIAGILGERTDHVVANWMVLMDLYTKGYLKSIKIIEKDHTVVFSKKEWNSSTRKNDLVSIIPLPEGAREVTTRGLKFKLRNENLKFGTSRGISNVAVEKKVRIKIMGGSIMIVHQSSD